MTFQELRRKRTIWTFTFWPAGDRSLIKLRELVFGEPWEAPSLRHNWWLGLSERPRPQIKPLRQKMPQHLEVLEQHSVAQVSTYEQLPTGSSPEVVAAAQAIFELGAHRATQLDPPKAGEMAMRFSSLGSGRSGSADSLNGIVEARAAAKVDKLVAAEAQHTTAGMGWRTVLIDAQGTSG